MADVVDSLTLCGGAGGVEVGGACWFLGVANANCTDTCAAAGFVYDAATETYAGSSGSEVNCNEVLDALAVPAGVSQSFECAIAAIDCYYDPNEGGRSRCTNLGDEGNAYITGERACACAP